MSSGLAQRQRKPDSRLAGGGADLDDPLGTDRFCQQPQQPPVGRGDVREARAFLCVLNGCQNSLLVVVLGQRRRLKRRLIGAARPRASATASPGTSRTEPGTLTALRTTTSAEGHQFSQFVHRQLAVLARVEFLQFRGRASDLVGREGTVLIGIKQP